MKKSAFPLVQLLPMFFIQLFFAKNSFYDLAVIILLVSVLQGLRLSQDGVLESVQISFI